jgi:hypothetical protein
VEYVRRDHDLLFQLLEKGSEYKGVDLERAPFIQIKFNLGARLLNPVGVVVQFCRNWSS